MPQLGSGTPISVFTLHSIKSSHATYYVTNIYHFGKFTVPPGWTTYPSSPGFEYEWEDVDSMGQKIAQVYGLASGRPICN